MKNDMFQELVDQSLSELVWDERKRQRALRAAGKEEKNVKKISTTFLVAAVVLCLSVTSLAAGLIFSPKYEAGKVAAEKMQAQYGITPELLSLFTRTVTENADGTSTVTYAAPLADFPAEQMGSYAVLVKGNRASVTWSNEGKSTAGGLLAEAFGAEQLFLLSRDYANSMQILTDAGKIAPKAAADVTPNPRLLGEIVWTQEDQAEADRAEAEARAQDALRLAEIAKAEASAKYSLQAAADMAKEALAQEYALTAAQREKMTFEPDSAYITYQENRPIAHLLFWLWQSGGEQFTEKDGQYWVSVNMETGVIEDILYDAGQAGNG